MAIGTTTAPIAIGDSAAILAQLLNGYTVTRHPNTISIPNASVLATLRDVTIKGTLIHKHLTHIDADGSSRSFTVPSKGKGQYSIEVPDGDIHFCLGTTDDEVHVPCELQHGTDWLDTYNQAIGSSLVVSGFFRCLFEHPGFSGGADAHIFEIHPARAVDFGWGTHAFDVDKPDDPAIHDWSDKVNTSDSRAKVAYDDSTDTLTFTHLAGQDTNYVHVVGSVSNIQPNAGSKEPSECSFSSDAIPNPVRMLCLKGTSAARQLESFNEGDAVDMVALRNIDLSQAIKANYSISLLGIDIQPSQ